MRKTLSQKIEENQQEMEQLKKRQDELMAQFNEQERKARNHRLCRRGGLVEKFLPELITLTDKQFDTFVEKVLLTNYARKILTELNAENEAAAIEPKNANDTPQGGNNAAQKPTEMAVRTDSAPIPKPTGTAHNGGAGGSANGGNSARQTS